MSMTVGHGTHNSCPHRFRPCLAPVAPPPPSPPASVFAQYYSEYMVLGSTFLFREGRAKGIGKIRRVIN